MESKLILAGDVGATKILLEAGDFRSDRWEPVAERRYSIEDFPHFHALIAEFLEDLGQARPGKAKIRAAAFGVAGPVLGNKVKMTNRPWTIDGDTIARRFKFPVARVINDLAASARGIDQLGPRDLLTLQGGRLLPDEPRVVMGIGTGLGMAYLIPGADGYEIVPGEGGHAGFSPASAQQFELARALFSAHGRVEAEAVVSGIGLANIYGFLRREADPMRAPADIARGATEEHDPRCIAALELFAECAGNIAGDHALSVMARGGVFIVGGVIAKLAPTFNADRFRAAFCAKGAFSSYLMKIPVRIVTSERIGVLGAARWAMDEHKALGE